MVQRKLPNKVAIQGEPVKTERRVASFKPNSSTQNQDAKTRGADLKKKMKKSSKPIRFSDLESLTSSPLRTSIPQPGKPPPQTPIRTSDGSPNYMKSTSCFDARKEVSQVSSRKIQHSNDNKNTRRSLGSKPTKCLTKSPSYKLVRTLTKTPSFKPARGSLKKSSRATCSSTLKDSKFPAFLMLSPGGTESEGTSAMKVCPYTYCSLNGHRHAPLPPLKCFLSARRRLLKTRKSGELSECPLKMEDLGNQESSHLVNDNSLDFFIEVYTENNEDGGAGFTCFNGDDEAAANIEDCVQFEEIVSEEISKGNFLHGDEYEDDADSTDTEMEEWEDKQFLSIEADDLDDLEDNDSDDVNEDCKGVFFTDEVEKDLSVESGAFEEQFYDEESEILSYDLEDAFEDMDATEGTVVKAETEFVAIVVTSLPSTEELLQDSELELELAETHCNQDLQVDDGVCLDSDVVDRDCVETNDECSRIQEEVLQFDHQLSDCDLVLQEESFNAEEQDHSSEQDEPDSFGILQVTDIDEPSDREIDQTRLNDNSDAQMDFAEGKNTVDDGVHSHSDVVDRDCVETDDECGRIQEEVFHFDHQLPDCDLAFQDESFNAEEQDHSPEQDETEQVTDIDEPSDWETDQTRLNDSDAQMDFAEGKHTVDDGVCSHSVVVDRDHVETNVECSRIQEEVLQFDHQLPDCDLVLQDESFNAEEQDHSPEQDETEQVTDIDKPSDLETDQPRLNDNSDAPMDIAEGKDTVVSSINMKKSSRAAVNLSQELPDFSQKCRRVGDESEDDPRNFNPREPNYLPLAPDPEAERVDLRHQLLDDRKNAEEWMLDYALQRTVTKLAPARKKKVALLVEAFESVMPTSKCDSHLRNTPGAFTQAKPIQACF